MTTSSYHKEVEILSSQNFDFNHRILPIKIIHKDRLHKQMSFSPGSENPFF